MKRRQYLSIVVGLTLVLCFDAAAQSIPAQLTDQEFWKLSTESSEPDGRFRSDNLLSNENWFQYVIPELNQTAKQGRVYMGVGPEQNFTYMAALKPKMAFIIDIRRGNLDLQLMYKALFELSKDRAEFVSRLFSKLQPDGLGADSTALQIFGAYSKVPASEALYKENLKAIQDHLVQKHAFPLAAGDLEGIDYVFSSFYRYGPDINYSSTQGGGGFGRVTYEELMVATDEMGQARSYLANEENRQLRRIQGNSRSRGLSQRHRRNSVGLLPVQRRAIPSPGRHSSLLLRQRRCAAAGSDEHVHSLRSRRPIRWGHGTEFRPGKYDERVEGLFRYPVIRGQSSGGGVPLLGQEGWTRHQENAAKLPLKGADGVVSSAKHFV